MDNTIYTDDSIQSLSPIEHIQTRPGMYIGNLSTPANLLVEISSNSVDEVNIGHGTHIWIDINDDGSVSVRDEGQGFPIGVKRDDGETVMQASVDIANTSGKFTNDGVYSGNSLGLNGLGMTVVMALSTEFEIYSYNNGKFEYDKYANGKFVEQKLGSYDGRYTPSGTLVKYTPDPKYFGAGKTDKAYFEKFFNELTCLVDNLEIVLNGKSIRHDSIADLLEMKLGKKNETVQHRMVVNNKDYKCAITFTDSADSDVNVWVNCGITSIGPQITSTKSTITRVVNNWARERGLLKDKDKNLSGSEIQEGMVLVSNITAKDVKYVAQVKSEISELDSNFTDDLQTALELYLDSYPEDGEKIISSAVLARKASEAAKRARQAVKNGKKRADKVKILHPDKLKDAEYLGEDSTLLCVEGNSGASAVAQGRDVEHFGILMLRGKLINSYTNSEDKLMKNEELQLLFKALNQTPYHYDASKLRYGRVAICTDADAK